MFSSGAHYISCTFSFYAGVLDTVNSEIENQPDNKLFAVVHLGKPLPPTSLYLWPTMSEVVINI